MSVQGLPLPEGYQLHDGAPPLDAYLHIRRVSGLTPVTPTQGRRALDGSWYCVHLTYAPPVTSETSSAASTEVVGLARVIGDGGWYFHVSDVAVVPTHQRKGLGNILMDTIMRRVQQTAEPGFYINLFADPPGRKLYSRWGFRDTMPGELGMGRWVGGKGEIKESPAEDGAQQ
ncbi:hypothetical protein L228DRAFT_271426 [Xylona heveae TC161]|uniref:N-acetyltransferase domain-containing protein n=1 Tax=Xylona heveae (strain CBS 132557 / TC161) TaxID=1328760 RepID=A0A164ZJD0_XYLHT|nr:hypothetical protein L228DRAFT_271426 [Xylona heveae TC161]KZF19170.1 hypothetical protein L228DRAFT_271426 [Xylona heveae TC161]